MKKAGTGIRGRQSALPAPRHLPLVDILVDAQAELQELVVASGLKVLAAMLGVVARIVTGPHDAHRQDPHWPMRYDTGRPSSVIRLRISQPRTTSLLCVSNSQFSR